MTDAGGVPAPIIPEPAVTVGSMSRRAGRGFVITFAGDLVAQVLLVVQGFLVPRLLGPDNVGLFALANAVVAIGLTVRELGIHEKVIQERDVDLPRAYSVAFTLELVIATVLFAVVVAAAPVMVAITGRSEVGPMVAVLAVTVYSSVFVRLPGALHLRNLDYGRQNLIAMARPAVIFAVTVPLAFLGVGVWSLVWGALAGTAASALIVLWGVPLRPRMRLERTLVRRYVAYGWPLWVANLLSLSTTWASSIVVSAAGSVAMLGFFTVSSQLTRQAFRLDNVLGRTIFPALARAQDDDQGQRRAFVASARVTMLWAAPIGAGLATFAPDLITHVLGGEWRDAELMFRMQGIAMVLSAIGYSLEVFYRVRGDTRPNMVFAGVGEAWVFVALLPGVAFWGTDGAAVAILLLGPVSLFVRQRYTSALFPGVRLVRVVWRETAAASAGAVAALVTRWAWGAPGSLWALVVLVVVFGLGWSVTLYVLDRAFLVGLYERVRPRRSSGSVGVEVEASEEVSGTGTRSVIEETHRHLLAVERTPGHFPLWITAAPDRQLWVTVRDASTLARFDPSSGEWSTRRHPLYPHVAAVSGDGAVWAALTLASSVVRVAPDGTTARFRVPRSRELLVAHGAEDRDGCLVVDAGNRCLLELAPAGLRRSVPLPRDADGEPMGRPDFVAVDGAGRRWITDTARTSVAVLGPDGHELIDVGAGTRCAVVDDARVVLGHSDLAALTLVEISTRAMTGVALDAVPFGLAFGPGVVWACLPDRDEVVAVTDDGVVAKRLALPKGSGPRSISVVDGVAWITCSHSNLLAAYDVSGVSG